MATTAPEFDRQAHYDAATEAQRTMHPSQLVILITTLSGRVGQLAQGDPQRKRLLAELDAAQDEAIRRMR